MGDCVEARDSGMNRVWFVWPLDSAKEGRPFKGEHMGTLCLLFPQEDTNNFGQIECPWITQLLMDIYKAQRPTKNFTLTPGSYV